MREERRKAHIIRIVDDLIEYMLKVTILDGF